MTLASVMALLVVAASPIELSVDASAVYGFGSRPAFGGLVGVTAQRTIWEPGSVDGRAQVGLLLGYQAEPYGLTAAAFLPATINGANHRFEVFAVVGWQLRFLESRRLGAAVQAFAGWTHVTMRGELVDSARNITQPYAADGNEFSFGPMLSIDARLSDRIAVLARFLAPVPYAGIALSSFFTVSLGVSIQL